ncbi:MAG TPA: transcriptional repressor [Candidatus Paceibacterota bacterium]
MENYRDIGFKLTPQRLIILDYLQGNKSHPSAEDIYRAVHDKFPTMSLATVYSTLAALKEKGYIIELSLDPDKKRYDPETVPHNHLICIACKRIVDVAGECRLDLPEDERQDFVVMESHVEFYGLCPGCKQKKKKPTEEVVHVHRS